MPQKKSVALSIFFDVSQSFESLQDNWFFRRFTDSGYSAEDLFSDMLGFYRAVNPGIDYISLCEPVEKNIVLGVWDKYGAVGLNKNYSFAPYLYPIPGSKLAGPMCVPPPHFLSTIKPAAQDPKLFLEFHDPNMYIRYKSK